METLEAASMNTTVSTKPAVLRSRTRCLAPASDALCFLLFNLSFFFLLITFKAALSATTYNLASLDARVESLEEEVANALGATDYFGNGGFANGATFRLVEEKAPPPTSATPIFLPLFFLLPIFPRPCP